MKKLLYLVLILFASYSYAEDNYKIELDNLFNQLKSTSSSTTAKAIETKIWDLWTTHPSEESLTNLLAKGSYYIVPKSIDVCSQRIFKSYRVRS